MIEGITAIVWLLLVIALGPVLLAVSLVLLIGVLTGIARSVLDRRRH